MGVSGSLPDLPDSTQAAVAVAVTRTSDLSAACGLTSNLPTGITLYAMGL
jgi:hypothetical protein